MDVLGSPTILLFDIDGVIRDVAGSYRRALQCIDGIGAGLPTAVVLDSALEGPSVTARDIADYTIDVEQQDGWGSQNVLRLSLIHI